MKTRMRKRAVAALLALALAAGLGGAAWASRTPTSLRIVTNPQGSLFYRAGAAVAKVLSDNQPLPARVQPYSGTSVALPLVDSGEVELSVNNTNDVRMAYRGMKPFLASPRLRLASVLFTLRVAMFVPARSDIHSVADLRGKRVAGEYKAQLAVWFNTTSILASAGLGWNDVTMVPTANVVTGADLLIENRVDSTLFALGAGKVQEANAKIPGGIRFIPINSTPEGVKRMEEAMPGTYPVLVKKGSTVGVSDDIVVEAYDCFLTTGTEISDDTVASIVKTLYNAEDQVRAAFPPFRSFSRKTMVKANATIPYHPGAVRAYKELGLWTPEMDAVQARLLSEAAR
jgi:uncharacterized protein